MPKNIRGTAGRVHFTASAARSSGDFVYENGFHGVVVTDTANGADGVMDTSQVEIELPTPAGVAARGDSVYMHASQVLNATAASGRLVGKVTDIAGVHGTPTGQCRILILPQNATVPA
jgi:predicted RecA/RadA family phage recombinase